MIHVTAYGSPGQNILIPVIPVGMNHYQLYGTIILFNCVALNVDLHPHEGAHYMAT